MKNRGGSIKPTTEKLRGPENPLISKGKKLMRAVKRKPARLGHAGGSRDKGSEDMMEEITLKPASLPGENADQRARHSRTAEIERASGGRRKAAKGRGKKAA